MEIDEKERLRKVYCRVTSGSAKLTTAADISRKTQIAAGSLYSFKRNLFMAHRDCVRLRNYFIHQGWMEGELPESRVSPDAGTFGWAGTPAGVVRVGELGDPESVLIGGLQNALVLAQDGTVPLRARLVHIRKQLRFLLDNFLDDASLPGGPEGG